MAKLVATGPKQWEVALLRALGIDHNRVLGYTLHASHDGPTTIEVEYLAPRADADELTNLFVTYTLTATPVEEPKTYCP